jgi:pimeloyl-ACP methyl ester carboxylesterase
VTNGLGQACGPSAALAPHHLVRHRFGLWEDAAFAAQAVQVMPPSSSLWLVIHGDADAIVPIEGSGQRTPQTVPHSELVRVQGAPHGLNLSHRQAFNAALRSFLRG